MATPYTEELGQAYTGVTVAQEAARCLLCHDAPCSKGVTYNSLRTLTAA